MTRPRQPGGLAGRSHNGPARRTKGSRQAAKDARNTRLLAVFAPSRGVAAPSRGVAAPSRGVAAPSRGVAAPSRGVAASPLLPVRRWGCGKPRRTPTPTRDVVTPRRKRWAPCPISLILRYLSCTTSTGPRSRPRSRKRQEDLGFCPSAQPANWLIGGGVVCQPPTPHSTNCLKRRSAAEW
jgi:hypothetical protein